MSECAMETSQFTSEQTPIGYIQMWLSDLRSCVKVEVAVLSSSLRVPNKPTVSVNATLNQPKVVTVSHTAALRSGLRHIAPNQSYHC